MMQVWQANFLPARGRGEDDQFFGREVRRGRLGRTVYDRHLAALFESAVYRPLRFKVLPTSSRQQHRVTTEREREGEGKTRKAGGSGGRMSRRDHTKPANLIGGLPCAPRRAARFSPSRYQHEERSGTLKGSKAFHDVLTRARRTARHSITTFGQLLQLEAADFVNQKPSSELDFGRGGGDWSDKRARCFRDRSSSKTDENPSGVGRRKGDRSYAAQEGDAKGVRQARQRSGKARPRIREGTMKVRKHCTPSTRQADDVWAGALRR